MTRSGGEAGSELDGRALCDIAQLLESAGGAEARVRGALELLREIVPYQQCALLDAEAGFDPRLVTCPEMAPLDENRITAALVRLFGKMLEERALASAPSPGLPSFHLAVPLIGLGDVIGVLFVSRSDTPYQVGDLRVLSVVAAQLAAYLTMLRVRSAAEDAVRTASSALRARDDLVNLVAEELRSPLEAARAWVRLLGSRTLSQAARARAVEAVERSVRTRARLLSDVFDLSSKAGLRLQLGAVEPAPLIEAAIEDLRPLAKQRSIQLESAIESVAPLLADAGRLDEILAILLANSFRLTPDGGRVEVRLEATATGARIRVIDSGAGFGPDRLPQLFDALDLREGGRRDGPEIGLAIAKRLVELHGGSIEAESPGEGQGATFTVGIPGSAPPAVVPHP